MNFRTFYFDDIDLKQVYDWIIISKNGNGCNWTGETYNVTNKGKGFWLLFYILQSQ